MKITKNRYLAAFVVVVLLLAVVRLVFPSVAKSTTEEPHVVAATDTQSSDSEAQAMPVVQPGRFFNAQGQVVKHRINSVPTCSLRLPTAMG